MKAVVFKDGELVVQETKTPEPNAEQVLVKVHAAGLNGADLLQRKGLYPAPAGSPQDIPGLEFAGEVHSCGAEVGKKGPQVGDRVMGIVGGGGQAEYIAVHARQVIPVPEQLDWQQAGGFAEVFTTAYDALFTQAKLKMGERVLVNGGAGGVGTAAIQLAVSAGAEVVATVRREELHSKVAELGCTVIAPDAEKVAQNGPYDVVLELVGAPNIPDAVKALNTGGRVSVIGVGAGQKTELSLLALMNKRASIFGSTLRSRPLEEKAHTAQLVTKHVLPLVEAGKLQVPLFKTFSLDDAEAAYSCFAEGGKFGKVVLTN